MIDIHADDYALSLSASETILNLCKNKYLNSISILPNMSCFEESMILLNTHNVPSYINCSVHINLIEGTCLSKPEYIPDLVDSHGKFKIGWRHLLLMNYSFGKRKEKYKEQIKREIFAQINKVQTSLNSTTVRVDSHQHTHMIPIIFDSLLEVLRENHYNIDYIRISKEPIVPFIMKVSLYNTYRWKNFLKNIILRFYSISAEKKITVLHIKKMYLWGLIMSGNMNFERLKILYKNMSNIAYKREKNLEILFHPGSIQGDEKQLDFYDSEALKFYLSDNRKNEEISIVHLSKLRSHLSDDIKS